VCTATPFDLRDSVEVALSNLYFFDFPNPINSGGQGRFTINGPEGCGDCSFLNLEVTIPLPSTTILDDLIDDQQGITPPLVDAFTSVPRNANTVGADLSVFDGWTVNGAFNLKVDNVLSANNSELFLVRDLMPGGEYFEMELVGTNEWLARGVFVTTGDEFTFQNTPDSTGTLYGDDPNEPGIGQGTTQSPGPISTGDLGLLTGFYNVTFNDNSLQYEFLEFNDDSIALVAIYNALDGPNWTDNTNWLTDPDIGTWFGVTTDVDGRVIKLDLNTNNLTGDLPPDVGLLSLMDTLDLTTNSISGEIPTQICNLMSLIQLRLADNDFVGDIPFGFGELDLLEELELSTNPITGAIPSDFGDMGNLRVLRLVGTELSGPIPPEIGNISTLETFETWNSPIGGELPSELGNLSNLVILHIGASGFINEVVPEKFPLTGPIPPELGGLTNLTRLVLGNNSLTGSIPPELGDLINLEFLGLHGNNLTGELPPELANLTNLTTFTVQENQLSGSVPIEYGNLIVSLQIDFGENQLSGNIPEEFGNISGGITRLELGNNQFRGKFPAFLENITTLQTLNLEGNEFLGPIPEEWTSLPLRLLNVSGNPICTEFPDYISDIGTLEFLFLSDAQLTGNVSESIEDLTSLVQFDVSQNELDTLPDIFFGSNFPSLEVINISGNNFSGTLSPDFATISSLQELNIRENNFIDLPDLTALAGIQVFDVSFNQFTFGDDLLPNVTVITQNDGQNVGPGAGTGAYFDFPITFEYQTADEAATDLSLADDQYSPQIPIGFPFEFYGIVYDSLYVSSNGFLTFDDPGGEPNTGCCSGDFIPDDLLPNNLIAGNWENWNPEEEGNVSYFVNGPEGDRVFVVEYDGVPHAENGEIDGEEAFLSMQIQLYERDFTIEVHTLDAGTLLGDDGEGGTQPQDHTQGVEDSEGMKATSPPGRNSESFTLQDDGVVFSPAGLLRFPETDSAYLANLFVTAGGFNWDNRSGWFTNSDINDWFGITATPDGSVTRIELDNNNLVGTLPEGFEILANLDTFDVESNVLMGPLPDSLPGALTRINVSNNQFTGNIPAYESDELVFFWAVNNQLEGIIEPGFNLPVLEQLELGGNGLTGSIPDDITNLTSLLRLGLAGNSLTGEIPDNIGNLTNLELLFLDNNRLEGEIPNSIGNLTVLEELFAQNNRLSGVPNTLNGLESIETLWLSQNDLTAENFPDISGLEFLTSLNLSDNRLRDISETFNSNMSLYDVRYNRLGVGDILSTPQVTDFVPQSGRSGIEVSNELPSEGETITLVAVDDGPNDEYQWFFNGFPIQGANERELILTSLTKENEGSYYCQITNTNLPEFFSE
jgi:Leucine-rich repeat (LRR) protein